VEIFLRSLVGYRHDGVAPENKLTTQCFNSEVFQAGVQKKKRNANDLAKRMNRYIRSEKHTPREIETKTYMIDNKKGPTFFWCQYVHH